MGKILRYHKGFVAQSEGSQITNWPALFEPMDYWGENHEEIQDQITAIEMGWA